uniref:hypothetical protein n=1 Tax=Clavibacter michiganensis TaxID=28447 RepID=UPI00292E6B73
NAESYNERKNVKMTGGMIHQVLFNPLFFCGALQMQCCPQKKCLNFEQIACFDVVTDLFLRIFNE